MFSSHQRVSRRRWSSWGILISLAGALALSGSARADFETIIDSPPAEFELNGTIHSNTQVNLYPGGVLPADYNIGPIWEPGDNIEINLLGGTIGNEQHYHGGLSTSSRWVRTTNVTVNLIDGTVWGDIDGTAGALITMSGATINGSLDVADGSLAIVTGGRITEELTARNGSSIRMSAGSVGSDQSFYYDGAGAYGGSVFLMSGGNINGSFIVNDSYASLTGGRIDGDLGVNSFGRLEISGGSTGSIRTYSGGKATLIGGEFQLDGVPVEGLGASTQRVDIPEGSVLTGVLSDGTPLILADVGYLHDRFEDGQVGLRLAPVPVSEPRNFDAPNDPIPAGLRTGQSLTLRPGAFASANFTALPGSTLSIVGGKMGHRLEAAGASVTLSAGSIGEQSIIYRGTTLQLSGGVIGSNFETASGSRLEISGGSIGTVFVAHPESEVIYSGGKFTGLITAESGSSFDIAGADFRLNGVPIATLVTPESEQQIDLPELGVLSGTLSDGTPFVFGDGGQWFAPGSLSLQVTDLPAAGPAIIRLPSDPVPQGLRSGQTLLLADGGEVGDHFTADWGSVVRMSGGRIGHRFQAVGSFVNVTGGEISSINALLGSVINIDGGAVTHHIAVRRGAIVNLSAGDISGTIHISDAGRFNMTGGSLGGSYGGYVYASGGSSLHISGGIVNSDINLYESSLTLQGGEIHGEISAYGNSQLDIQGGRLGDGLFVSEGGQATLRGSDFRIDGEPIGGDSVFSVTDVDLPTGAVLSGVFTDGTPFAFTSSDGDRFWPGTLQVASSPSYFFPRNSFPLFGKTLPQGLKPGEELTLESGEQVGTNFTAGWDSELTIAGGEIGRNLEAVGAEVNLLEGSIGDDMDALFGTEFNVLGGIIGTGLEAHRGSVVNISGGTVPEIGVRSGSTVNITGGILGGYFDGEYNSGSIDMETGSALHVTGTDFVVNGRPIEGLEAGSSIVLEWDERFYRSMRLSARLLDGSPFTAYLSNYPWATAGDWQSGGAPTITLTAVSYSSVPEPSSLALAMSLFMLCTYRPSRFYAS